MVSIICPVYNESKYISKCLDALLEQDYPSKDLEILFVDGMSTDTTRNVILEKQKSYNYIRLIDNPNKNVPYALNIGIENAQGEIIVRIDAHASYPSNYISTLIHYLQKLPHAQNVGAACITQTLGTTDKAKAIVAVLSNRFGVGNSTFRLGTKSIQEVDTVPFGCWNKQTLKDVGMFDTRLIRNQDIELNKRILRRGGKIYLIPDTYCVYYARETYKKLSENNYENGKWNILTLYYTHDLQSLSLRHFIPLVFVLSLLIPIFGMIVTPYIGLLAGISLISYTFLILIVSTQIALQQKINWLTIVASFCILHLSYGIGSLVGICTLPFIKR